MKRLIFALITLSSSVATAGPVRGIGRMFADEVSLTGRPGDSTHLARAFHRSAAKSPRLVQDAPLATESNGESLDEVTRAHAIQFAEHVRRAEEIRRESGDEAVALRHVDEALRQMIAVYQLSANNAGNRLIHRLDCIAIPIGFMGYGTAGGALALVQLAGAGATAINVSCAALGATTVAVGALGLKVALKWFIDPNAVAPFRSHVLSGRRTAAVSNIRYFWQQVDEALPRQGSPLIRLRKMTADHDLQQACERLLGVGAPRAGNFLDPV